MKYVELLRERKLYGVCNGMIVFKVELSRSL